jgi:hypothetical protein
LNHVFADAPTTVERRPTVASGRLDGLPRPRHTLLRHALPEDCQSRGCAPQMREAVGTTSRMARPTVAPLLVLRRARESRALLSKRHRATAGVPYTVLCRRRSSFDGHNAVWGSPGNGLPENCVTATKQAVETPGGGRSRPRMTFASRHRRAASRSGGATSAERDGRPVGRRTGPGALLPSEVLRSTGLLSHSAAPLLQLASLRRPGSRLPIDRQRSPPVVSTAFLVPGTRFPVTGYPRIARLDILLIETQRQRQNVEPGTSHRCAHLVLTGAREPRAPLST